VDEANGAGFGCVGGDVGMKSNYPITSLGEVCEVIAGQHISSHLYNREGQGVPYLTGPADFGITKPIISKWTESPKVFASERDILLTVKGNGVGKSNLGADAAIGRQLMALRPTEKLDQNYLFHFVRVQEDYFFSRAQGATVPGIVKNDIATTEIPLPPLAEQRRIAAILDKADAIRRKRQQAIQYTEELLRAAFLDMFGDPVTNPKGWEVAHVEELAIRITKGESPKWQGFSYQDQGVLFVTSENVLWGEIDYSEPKFISEEFHTKLKRSQLFPHDILINLVGASVGRTCMVPQEAIPANINQAVAVVSLNQGN
jgi:type I restriction enzyme S subunit